MDLNPLPRERFKSQKGGGDGMWKLIFEGQFEPDIDRITAVAALSERLQLDADRAEVLFSGRKMAVKSADTAAGLESVAAVFRRYGAIVEIQSPGASTMVNAPTDSSSMTSEAAAAIGSAAVMSDSGRPEGSTSAVSEQSAESSFSPHEQWSDKESNWPKFRKWLVPLCIALVAIAIGAYYRVKPHLGSALVGTWDCPKTVEIYRDNGIHARWYKQAMAQFDGDYMYFITRWRVDDENHYIESQQKAYIGKIPLSELTGTEAPADPVRFEAVLKGKSLRLAGTDISFSCEKISDQILDPLTKQQIK